MPAADVDQGASPYTSFSTSDLTLGAVHTHTHTYFPHLVAGEFLVFINYIHFRAIVSFSFYCFTFHCPTKKKKYCTLLKKTHLNWQIKKKKIK